MKQKEQNTLQLQRCLRIKFGKDIGEKWVGLETNRKNSCHMTEQELIIKLEELMVLKKTEISNHNYERAAQIRHEIRKYTEQLEELMNK